MPSLDFSKFTVALRLKPEDLAARKSNVLTGGELDRWFGIRGSENGNLVVTFNNQEFAREIKDTKLHRGEWAVIACSVDLSKRKVLVCFNGKVSEFDLPEDFKLRVLESDDVETARNWTFTDYGDGNVFHGWVDEFRVYGRAFSAHEMQSILLRP